MTSSTSARLHDLDVRPGSPPVLQVEVCVLCLPPGFPAVPHDLGHTTVRSRLLAEPDLECYTIRLPARVFHRGTGERSGTLSTPRTRHPPRRRAFRAPPGGGHAVCVKRASVVATGSRILSV